jgi:DNA-binding IclR family transcriptional regulator
MRALGRLRINTAEIAKALKLPVNTVDGTLKSLKDKGVKVIG